MGRIVLISDDEQLRSLLCGLLLAHGFGAVVGVDTKGALAPRRAVDWDVAIVDTCVNYADALRAFKLLKTKSAALVAIFAKKNGAPAPPELVAGGGLLLGKPFDPRELLLIIRGLLDDETRTAPAARSKVAAGPIT